MTAPPSKSYTHRAMVLGALTHSHFTLRNPLISEDTKATLDALYALGSEVRSSSGEVRIHCEALRPAPAVIDARNSGTTIRLFAGLAALLPASTTLTGDDSLIKRPLGPLVDALSQLGARCTYLGVRGRPPLSVRGPMTGKRTDVEAGVSSQFVSSLIIACSQKAGDTAVNLKGALRSRPYVDITLQIVRDFGGRVVQLDSGYLIPGEQVLSRDSYTVPGDYSSAAFPLAAAAVTGGEVTVRNLDEHSPQGDRALVDHLRAFGARVSTTSDSVTVAGAPLRGANIDVRDTPDLFPVLAVIGCAADGKTVLTGGESLKEKESDRIATTTAFLQAMGARILAKSDGCEIVGGEKLHGSSVRSEGDHRIMMAAAVAGLVASSETRIDDDQSFMVSYPGFLRDMHQLRCRLEVRK